MPYGFKPCLTGWSRGRADYGLQGESSIRGGTSIVTLELEMTFSLKDPVI